MHYQRMDLDTLGDRFSGSLLRGIRDEVLPALGRNYNALEQTLAAGQVSSPRASRVIGYARANLKKMSRCGQRFAENPRYLAYSETTHELDRQRLFREEYFARFSKDQLEEFEKKGIYHPRDFPGGPK